MLNEEKKNYGNSRFNFMLMHLKNIISISIVKVTTYFLCI